jgi:ABC-2 type transport system ATP-binding protein
MMSMLLRTERLTKDYNSYRALAGLDLTVAAGEVFGLLGPNGSGKTTALRLVMGFLRPTSGRALIAGHDCWHDGVAARKHLAYLPGELRLYENMTGRQLITFLCDIRGMAPAPDLDAQARRLEIDLERPIANLSSGMKRKVALLQVLSCQAPLVILDEPTNTLDPNMRDQLLSQLRQARDRGQAVLFSSHVLSEVEQVCDRVGILEYGKLVHVQNMAELREGRLIHVQFVRPPQSPPELPGLKIGSWQADHASFEIRGDLSGLLGWLAGQSIRDLRIEPLGLSAIYQLYHGGEE